MGQGWSTRTPTHRPATSSPAAEEGGTLKAARNDICPTDDGTLEARSDHLQKEGLLAVDHEQRRCRLKVSDH